MDEEAFEAIYRGIDNRIAGALRKIEKEALPANYEAIRRFDAHLEAKGLSKHRRLTCLNRIGNMARKLKVGFKEATREDLEPLVADVRKRESQASVFTYAACIRPFYRWLFGLEPEDKLPAAIAWFKETKPINKLRKEDLPTEEEVASLVAAAPDLTMKTLISFAFETGARPAELLSLRGKDIHINGVSAKCYISGKTRKHTGERNVFCVRSYTLLRMLADSLKSPEDLLFRKKTGRAFTGADYTHALQRIAVRAGVKKHLTPYTLRHARATLSYRDLGEQVAKKMLGHSPDSSMARTYVHLADDDVEDAILRANGLTPEKERVESTKCPICKQPSYYGEKICSKCSSPLTLEGAVKVDSGTQELLALLKDEEVIAALRAIKAKGRAL